MRIYFARHGESEANAANIYSNRVNGKYPLTQHGIRQAQQLVISLRQIPFINIYSSPLLRATQTAEILSKGLYTDMEVTNALQEYDTGILEEQSKTDERKSLYEENEMQWFVNKNFDHKIEGGESLNDIQHRFVPFIQNVEDQFGNQNGNILFVAHGGIYQAMFPIVLKNILFETSYKDHLGNCEYVVAELRDSGLYCIRWRDSKTL